MRVVKEKTQSQGVLFSNDDQKCLIYSFFDKSILGSLEDALNQGINDTAHFLKQINYTHYLKQKLKSL
jgi:hypothetical protein